MVQKPVLLAVFVLVMATLACSLFSGRGKDSNKGSNSAQSSGSEGQVSGERVFRELGCSGCHGAAAGNIAPSLENLYGNEVQLENGETAIADEDYLRESILSPGAKIVAGYQPVMPDFSRQVSNEELDALVEYIRSLSE